MILTDDEQKELEVMMRYFGCKEYNHAFFDSKEYKNFRNDIIDGVPSSQDDRFDIDFCDIHDILKDGKYVLCKHTNNIDIRIPYTNGNYLRSSIVKFFGKTPEKEDYKEIYSYIENNCELPKVTDIPICLETTAPANGRVTNTWFYGVKNGDMEFYDNLPIIVCGLSLSGDCTDLMKTTYVHELYHALINRHKGNIINVLNREMVSIFMEKVAALDLDPTLELLDLENLDRIISTKRNVLAREICLFNNENGLDCITNEGYILSTLEATALFSTYKSGSNRVKKEIDKDINSVISGETVLEDVIDKYEATPEKGSRLVKKHVRNYFRC